MKSKNQYLQTIVDKRKYFGLSRRQKKELLDEYCSNTGQSRKYIIRKINSGGYLSGSKTKIKRKRSCTYPEQIKAPLVALWRIFDYPCGQRLKSSIETELDRLREQKEIICSDKIASLLMRISARTIDTKLTHQKKVERIRIKYQKQRNPLLYQKIPVKLSDEWDRSALGNIQLDLVEHCGQSARGDFINTLAHTDISSGWWEAEAIIGRSQYQTHGAIDRCRHRYPFPWQEIHSDNDTAFINDHIYRYTLDQNQPLGFSRSRPYKKNDNCFIEQKNWTHVKKFVGYLRYDSKAELDLLNDLYCKELRLYKNFFCPVIKLISKERVGAKIKRKYDKAKTPYHRLMESEGLFYKTKAKLEAIYTSLNPAELKREIDRKLKLLHLSYQAKNNTQEADIGKKQKPSSVTFINCRTEALEPILVT